MKFEKTTLSHGLRVLTVPMPSLESVNVTIWVATGSRKEDKATNGISHFLEHMTFKGSKKRSSAREIAEAVDSFGGEFNASTSKEWTNFYIKARSANLDVAFDVLSDMVLNPILKKEEVEREKGVIIEEIAMYEDTPLWKIWEVFEALIFEGDKLGWDIAGSAKTVRATKKSDFESYRSRHYYGENMLVTVTGSTDHKKSVALAKKHLSKLPSSKDEKWPSYEVKQNKPRIKLHPQKKEQAHFVLGFPGPAMSDEARIPEAVLASILGGGMSSRLFTEVRERRGLAYSVRSETEHFVDTGYISAYAGVDPKKAEDAIKVTLDQFYGIADGAYGRDGKYKIGDKELKKAKEYLKGHLALSLEDTLHVSRFFGPRELLLKKEETPEDIFAKIDKVTVKDVLAVAKKYIDPTKLNLAVIGPFKSQAKFEKLIK